MDQLYDHWKEQLVVNGISELFEPVGCEPVPTGVIPYQLRICVGEWIVEVKVNMSGADPRTYSSYISVTQSVIHLVYLFRFNGGTKERHMV